MNELFFHDGGYKMNKATNQKKPKKQVNKFTRVKIVIILSLRNKKVFFLAFHVKTVYNKVP